MRTWSDELATAWLASAPIVRAFHEWARDRMAAHRGGAAPKDSLAPWTVETLVASARGFGETQRWLWATCALANIAELVFCVDDGRLATSRAIQRTGATDIIATIDVLRTIRNACFHPAFSRMDDAGDLPHLAQLVPMLEAYDSDDVRRLAERLRRGEWSRFAERPMTSFTLARLNEAALSYAEQLRARRTPQFQLDEVSDELTRLRPAWAHAPR